MAPLGTVHPITAYSQHLVICMLNGASGIRRTLSDIWVNLGMRGSLDLDKYLIRFSEQEWVNNDVGVRSKQYICGSQRVRLVEFTEGFVEPDWCTNGHAGYVLEGSFSIDFSGTYIRFNEGDGLFIPEGGENKHKAVLGTCERVLLVLFEKL